MCSEADTCPSGVDACHLSCSVKPILGGKPHSTYAMWKIKPGFQEPATLNLPSSFSSWQVLLQAL